MKMKMVMEIGYATSLDGETWELHDGGDAILTTGSGPDFDRDLAAAPSVIYDGDTFHMWYSGCRGWTCDIGYASSADGLSWTKHPDSPVFSPRGSGYGFDSTSVFSPTVVHDGEQYRMWYEAEDSDGDLTIGYADSDDGMDWSRDSYPVFEPAESWEDPDTLNPYVLLSDEGVHLWYAAGDIFGWGETHIGYAFSVDGIEDFERLEDPVLSPDGTSWYGEDVFSPKVLSTEAGLMMWFAGGNGDRAQIGMARGE